MNEISSGKIKILFGINKLAVGGAEHLLLHILHHIDRSRFEAHLVTLLPSSIPNLEAEATDLLDNWQKFRFKGFFDLFSYYKLYRYLKKERFDVVYANLFFTGVVLRITAYLARVPIIFVSELNVYEHRTKKWIWIERVLSCITDRIIAASQITLESSSKQLRLPQSKYELNYNAIDVDASWHKMTYDERVKVRLKFGFESNDILITTAGRMVSQKGQHYLIEAFDILRKVHKGTNLKLVIIGRGELKESLTHAIEEKGLGSLSKILDPLPLYDIIGMTDIFVFPSLWEGLPLTLLEVSAAGLPIVATSVGGVPEVIEDGINGFLVTPKDPKVLAEKIGILLENKDVRDKFSINAKMSVKKFSIENHLKKLYIIIDSVIKK